MTNPSDKHHIWNANLYDHNHAFVSHFGESLLEWLSPKRGETICDIGCGTGDLTQKITQFGATVIGIDSSSSMIKQASQKYPELTFQVQDIQTLSFEGTCDAIFSNAALHWIKESDQAAASISKALKPGGRFVAEFGGKDNVKFIIEGIYSALDHFGFPENKSHNPWFFPSLGSYASTLERHGFRVHEAIYFDRPTALEDGNLGLQNWLDMFSSFFFVGIPQPTKEQIFTYIEDKLRPSLFKEGTWFADYKRLRLKAEKI